MYREAIKQLELWKCGVNRKPLILRGARQVGKTWIMKEFGKQYYRSCAYISMDENERMKEVFREAFDIDRIIEMLEIEVGFKIDPEGNTQSTKVFKVFSGKCTSVSHYSGRFSFGNCVA